MTVWNNKLVFVYQSGSIW